MMNQGTVAFHNGLRKKKKKEKEKEKMILLNHRT
jgi:hypothetical protein